MGWYGDAGKKVRRVAVETCGSGFMNNLLVSCLSRIPFFYPPGCAWLDRREARFLACLSRVSAKLINKSGFRL